MSLQRPLQIPIRTAGLLVGLKSEAAAYLYVPQMFQVVKIGQRQVVPAIQVANKMGVSLEQLWQAVEAIDQEDKATEPARLAKEAAEKEAADERRAKQREAYANTNTMFPVGGVHATRNAVQS